MKANERNSAVGPCHRAANAGPFLFFLMMAVLLPAWSRRQARTYTVRGEIVSLIDGLPLPGIRVQLKGTRFSAVTDSGGVFQIRKVPPGTYDLVAKYPDFEATILRGIEVPPRAGRAFVFTLNPEDHRAPVPLHVDQLSDSLGFIEGKVSVEIDTFRTRFENGRLMLKAVVAGNLTESYIYPQRWKLLPVEEIEFRFQFVLPRGKVYHLYLIWQEEGAGYLKEKIVDVFRDDSGRPRKFDLTQQRTVSNALYRFFARKIDP